MATQIAARASASHRTHARDTRVEWAPSCRNWSWPLRAYTTNAQACAHVLDQSHRLLQAS